MVFYFLDDDERPALAVIPPAGLFFPALLLSAFVVSFSLSLPFFDAEDEDDEEEDTVLELAFSGFSAFSEEDLLSFSFSRTLRSHSPRRDSSSAVRDLMNQSNRN